MKMDVALEELYFTWLYDQVGNSKAKSRTKSYDMLMRKLFLTEFVYFVFNDDNRWEDGKELRYQFLVDNEIDSVDSEFIDIGCSFLEMLIALCHRISFLTDTPTQAWFWHILGNLGIADCNDAAGDFDAHVDGVLERVIFRLYEPDGKGGMFPLRRPEHDQRQVEIWYQMSAYLIENS